MFVGEGHGLLSLVHHVARGALACGKGRTLGEDAIKVKLLDGFDRCLRLALPLWLRSHWRRALMFWPGRLVLFMLVLSAARFCTLKVQAALWAEGVRLTLARGETPTAIGAIPLESALMPLSVIAPGTRKAVDRLTVSSLLHQFPHATLLFRPHCLPLLLQPNHVQRLQALLLMPFVGSACTAVVHFMESA